MKNRIRLAVCIVVFICVCFSFSSAFAYAEPNWVYLGGTPLGIGLAEDGVIVTGIVDVITDEGAVCPSRGSEISTGVVIIAVNDERLTDVRDFASKL